MLPKLSERAAARCSAHIRRHYPDWKQAKILNGGFDSESQATLSKMRAFILDCKAHLSSLRERIAEGERPCIDTGWPKLNETAKTPDKACNLEKAIEEQRARADAAEAKLIDREVSGEPEQPPAEIADLFDPQLTPRQNQDALLEKYRKAKGEEEYARDAGDMTSAMNFLKQAERYESGINWNRAVYAEVLG